VSVRGAPHERERQTVTSRSLALSVVVVAYDMERELPRTLRSLSQPYQRDLDGVDYEIIVVDNGSPVPIAPMVGVRLHRLDAASPSPAHAANVGLGMARGELVGLIIDGARIASSRLLATALLAAGHAARAVVTAPAWHLGARGVGEQAASDERASEEALLARIHWEDDGYELFTVSTPAGSSSRGLFGAMGESSSLFLSRALWREVGGLDERFSLPGGGLVNHDLYRRACGLPGAQLVVLLGEGTFHQAHDGAATSGRIGRAEMWDDYERIRGEPHRPPTNDPLYVGRVPKQYLPYLRASLERAEAGRSASAAGRAGAQSA